MGQDAFLKFKDIKGDVTDANHADEIEISSFSFSVSNIEDALLKEEERLEGATVGGISISKKVDRASPKLLAAACGSTDLGESVVYFCRPKGTLGTSSGLETYMTFTLSSTSIQDYSLNGGSGYPTENLTLQFVKLEWELKDEKGGVVSSPPFLNKIMRYYNE